MSCFLLKTTAPGAGPGAVATWDSSVLYDGHSNSSFVLYVQRKVALPLGVTVFCQFKVTNTKSPLYLLNGQRHRCRVLQRTCRTRHSDGVRLWAGSHRSSRFFTAAPTQEQCEG